ncbi:NAD(P)/FAD-dependent oxidoreductase, partial [Streptococcus anginosus]|uniref:NAD(P)/FAD-dependent oxidoreductase n=1 Tax=Streptococcus anginosus TaxID=1328 RepID=UPI0021F896E0
CNSDVVAIQSDKKTITVQDTEGEHSVSYDKLLLSPGGYAVKPPIEGIDLENINTFRGPEDTAAVKEQMEGCQSAVIIGGG